MRRRYDVRGHALFIIGVEYLLAEAGVLRRVVDYLLIVAGVAKRVSQCSGDIVPVAAVLSSQCNYHKKRLRF